MTPALFVITVVAPIFIAAVAGSLIAPKPPKMRRGRSSRWRGSLWS